MKYREYSDDLERAIGWLIMIVIVLSLSTIYYRKHAKRYEACRTVVSELEKALR